MFLQLFEELEKLKFRKGLRKNVFNKKYGYMIFHWTSQKYHSPAPASVNLKNPEVYRLLMKIIKLEDADFEFTSIIVNKNVICKKHKDTNNVGLSYSFSVGDFEGGELVINGKVYNTKNKLIKFDGSNQEHYSLAFKGVRYSIVYYSLNRIVNHLKKIKN